jgi:hypothetical protein
MQAALANGLHTLEAFAIIDVVDCDQCGEMLRSVA